MARRAAVRCQLLIAYNGNRLIRMDELSSPPQLDDEAKVHSAAPPHDSRHNGGKDFVRVPVFFMATVDSESGQFLQLLVFCWRGTPIF